MRADEYRELALVGQQPVVGRRVTGNLYAGRPPVTGHLYAGPQLRSSRCMLCLRHVQADKDGLGHRVRLKPEVMVRGGAGDWGEAGDDGTFAVGEEAAASLGGGAVPAAAASARDATVTTSRITSGAATIMAAERAAPQMAPAPAAAQAAPGKRA